MRVERGKRSRIGGEDVKSGEENLHVFYSTGLTEKDVTTTCVVVCTDLILFKFKFKFKFLVICIIFKINNNM